MPLISHHTDGHLTTLALASPPANALGLDLLGELDAALDEIAAGPSRVLLVTSDVPRFFVAGADLKLLAESDRDGFVAYLGTLRAAVEKVAGLPQTSIAVVDGMALGGGLELALACTLRVVSPAALLGVPEIKLGLLPGAAGTQRLTHVLGPSRALDLLLTGRSMTGEEALERGLADRLADDPLATARALGEEIAAFPRSATAAVRRCVRAALDDDFADGCATELAEIAELFSGPDAREGVAAFVEKRAPAFSS